MTDHANIISQFCNVSLQLKKNCQDYKKERSEILKSIHDIKNKVKIFFEENDVECVQVTILPETWRKIGVQIPESQLQPQIQPPQEKPQPQETDTTHVSASKRIKKKDKQPYEQTYYVRYDITKKEHTISLDQIKHAIQMITRDSILQKYTSLLKNKNAPNIPIVLLNKDILLEAFNQLLLKQLRELCYKKVETYRLCTLKKMHKCASCGTHSLVFPNTWEEDIQNWFICQHELNQTILNKPQDDQVPLQQLNELMPQINDFLQSQGDGEENKKKRMIETDDGNKYVIRQKPVNENNHQQSSGTTSLINIDKIKMCQIKPMLQNIVKEYIQTYNCLSCEELCTSNFKDWFVSQIESILKKAPTHIPLPFSIQEQIQEQKQEQPADDLPTCTKTCVKLERKRGRKNGTQSNQPNKRNTSTTTTK